MSRSRWYGAPLVALALLAAGCGEKEPEPLPEQQSAQYGEDAMKQLAEMQKGTMDLNAGNPQAKKGR